LADSWLRRFIAKWAYQRLPRSSRVLLDIYEHDEQIGHRKQNDCQNSGEAGERYARESRFLIALSE